MSKHIPGLAYRVSNVLYVALTSRSVGRPLMQLRGAGYRLPEASGFQPLAEGAVVTAADVDAAVDAANDAAGLAPFGTVFAGHVGDPLLELDTLEASLESILQKRRGMAIGILTSGAFDISVAERLCAMRERLAIETISVAVNIAAPDPNTYSKVTGGAKPDFQKTCTFVATLTENGFPVIGLAVQHPAVARKLRAVKTMAAGLGTADFLELPYYATTLYDTLQLDAGLDDASRAAVTNDDVKAAFRKLSFQYHPDQAAAAETEEEADAMLRRYEDITEAYGVLKDPARRALYDAGVCDLTHADHSNEKFLLMNPKTGHTN